MIKIYNSQQAYDNAVEPCYDDCDEDVIGITQEQQQVLSEYDDDIAKLEQKYFAILSSAISDALIPASCNSFDEATAKRCLLGGSLDDLVLIGLELDYIHRVICQGANYEETTRKIGVK